MNKENLFDKINRDLQAALKNKESLRLNVLRMMKSKILYVNARGELSESEIIKILAKYSKELKESIGEFKKLGKTSEAAEHEKELALVSEYLPEELSADEIKKAVQAAIAAAGAVSIKDLGRVMKEVLAQHPGIDGKAVNQFVRELLGG